MQHVQKEARYACQVSDSFGQTRLTVDLDADLRGHRAICDACGVKFTLDLSALRKVVDNGKSVLRADESGSLDQSDAAIRLPELIHELIQFLPTSSYPLQPLIRLQALLLVPPKTQFDLERAVSSLASAYSGAQHVYPAGHPTLAIILGEWGKLLAMDIPPDWSQPSRRDTTMRLESAIVVLRRAVQACERGFGGDGGLVGRELEGLLRGCEGELGLVTSA